MTSATCIHCCLETHKYHLFHRIQIWNGRYFQTSSLYAQGHVVFLGHEGRPCPQNHSAMFDHNKDVFVEGVDLSWEEEQDLEGSQNDEEVESLENLSEDLLVLVHTTGIFRHRVRWCTCPGSPERHIQLLRMRLFSCSLKRPRTAFSFNVLDHFYADAMECKTSAQSFCSKLRRLTNNAFPHMVPVSTLTCIHLLSNHRKLRIVKRNSHGYPDNGEICTQENDLDLVMKWRKLREMVIWLFTVLLVPNLVSIYDLIGKMIPSSQHFFCLFSYSHWTDKDLQVQVSSSFGNGRKLQS
jgi:hypothetical protein